MKKDKTFRQMVTLLTANFFGMFGSGMLSFAIGLYILHKTGSALGMGITLMVGPLVALVLTPFVGYMVDTRSHRAIMIGAQIGTSIGLLLFALAFMWWPAFYYPEVIGLLIILTITDRFLSTALSASLVTLFPTDVLQRVNSLNQSVSSLAQLISPIIGAVIYSFVSIGTFALVEIVFELLTLVCILRLNFTVAKPAAESATAEMPATPAAKESLLANFAEGLRYLQGNRLILLSCLFGAGINFLFAAVNVGLPYLQVTVLKMPNTLYGITDSGFAVGMILGGVALSMITLKHHPFLVSLWGIMLLGSVLTLLGIPEQMAWPMMGNVFFYGLLNVANGIILVVINTPISTMMQKLIPQAMQGRVFMLTGTISSLLMPLGTLVFGFLFDRMAAWIILLGVGLLTLLMSFVTVVYVQRTALLAEFPA
ncbi:MFS transporter [Schleiferilactobacillus harbinensis]|uniref:MFS transporter n=1 Tax=Schleiferilactobacillus harbinensis TaxID=304207 RepID=UPI00116984A7|nr:MFS transporter [Schleiferilactobacillus harbinensis]GEK06350.1 MFS transporter [Schleiferilactobacillus harbinensis]